MPLASPAGSCVRGDQVLGLGTDRRPPCSLAVRSGHAGGSAADAALGLCPGCHQASAGCLHGTHCSAGCLDCLLAAGTERWLAVRQRLWACPTALPDMPALTPPMPPPPRRLFVGNIPKTYTRCELMAIFSVCGCIIELRLHSDRATRASHGSACASHGSAFLW